MKEILNYVRQILTVEFKRDKFSGHDFYSGFPQPMKKNMNEHLLSLLYYAVEDLSKVAYEKDIKSYRYDFLRDETLKQSPGSMMNDRRSMWILWEILQLIKEDLSKYE